MPDNNSRPRMTPEQSQAQKSQLMFTMVYMLILLVNLTIISNTTLRNDVGGALSVVLIPMIGFNYRFPLLTIVLVGVLIGLVTSVPRYFFTDWLKMGRLQQRQRFFNKAFREAYRNNQKDKIQKMQKMRMQMSTEQMQQSMNTTKPLMVLSFFTLLLFAWVYYFIDRLNYKIVAYPWNFNINVVTSHISVAEYWMITYAFTSLVIGYLATMLIKYVDFTFKLRKMEKQETIFNESYN